MTILHIEDDENDVCLVAGAVLKLDPTATIFAVPFITEAQAYLEGRGQYSDRERFPLPGVILLDLILPLQDGFDFLRWRMHTGHGEGIPVVALTSSLDEKLLWRALEMGATHGYRKPTGFRELTELLQSVCQPKEFTQSPAEVAA